ncbi:MAG: DNA mismatch endonuclease Vsr [Bryobacteraceae bacterium]
MPQPRDIVSRAKRSEMMRRVGQQRTPIERAVGEMLTALGARYRLNNRRLPGSPDFSNQTQGWAVFVNGCFWHGHTHCRKTKSSAAPRVPARNRSFWEEKIAANRARDERKCRELRALGLRVAVVWECELRHREKVRRRLERAISPRAGRAI